ncbi:hypothetical protein BJX76DRAFT_349738 [Aspergillus varians]
MPLQHLIIIDVMLSMPGVIIKGRTTPRPTQSCRRPVPDNNKPNPPAKRQRHVLEDDTEMALRQAMEYVQALSQKQRPTICFLCLGNPNLPLKDRIAKRKTPGSLTRHFLRKHINPSWPARGVECNVFGMELRAQKADLLNHTKTLPWNSCTRPNSREARTRTSTG